MSAVIERRPFNMSVIRPAGTPRSRANLFALNCRASNSRLRNRPGCAIGVMDSSFVIVDDPNVVGIAVAKFEAYPPAAIRRHRPLPPALALEQSDALQRTEIVQALGDIQREQEVNRLIEIKPRKRVRFAAFPNFAADRIAPGSYHGKNVTRESVNRKLSTEARALQL